MYIQSIKKCVKGSCSGINFIILIICLLIHQCFNVQMLNVIIGLKIVFCIFTIDNIGYLFRFNSFLFHKSMSKIKPTINLHEVNASHIPQILYVMGNKNLFILLSFKLSKIDRQFRWPSYYLHFNIIF